MKLIELQYLSEIEDYESVPFLKMLVSTSRSLWRDHLYLWNNFLQIQELRHYLTHMWLQVHVIPWSQFPLYNLNYVRPLCYRKMCRTEFHVGAKLIILPSCSYHRIALHIYHQLTFLRHQVTVPLIPRSRVFLLE